MILEKENRSCKTQPLYLAEWAKLNDTSPAGASLVSVCYLLFWHFDPSQIKWAIVFSSKFVVHTLCLVQLFYCTDVLR